MNPSFLKRIVDHKHREVAAAKARVSSRRLLRAAGEIQNRRSLAAALEPATEPGVKIIAEVKRASPSKGLFCPDLDAGRQAALYQEAGAAAISVLTDEHFFKGSGRDLTAAREATCLPVLRKDFLVSSYQIVEAAAWGADAVLLIARILTVEQLRQYLSLCDEFNMDALVEVHSPEDLAKVQQTPAFLIGINNRDLETFETDPGRATELVRLLGPGQIPVAASGIAGPGDVRRSVEKGLTNFLVGESLVCAQDVKGLLQAMLAAGHPPATR